MPGQPLQLSEAERERLGMFLLDLCSQCERDNRELFRNINTWWSIYEGKPAVETRTTPWVRASNVVLPLCRIYCDAVKARLVNTIFGAPDLWTFRTRNEDVEAIARETVEFDNWAVDDNECDIYTPSSSWLDEATVLGSSIMLQTWTARKRYVFMPGEGGKPQPIPVELGRGPNFTHIPRDQVLAQYGRPIADSEYLFIQSPKTWGDLCTMEQFAEIDEGYLDKVKPDGNGGATRQIQRTKQQAAGQDESDELYDIRQAWIEWPVMRGLKFEEYGEGSDNTPIVPLLVTFDRTTGTVLRVKGKPYYTRGWPVYEAKVRTTADHRNPAGLAKMLDPLQRGATVTFNQAVDAITFANSVAGFTTDPRLQSATFTPGHYNLVSALDQVREANHSKVISPDISLINMMMSFAERLTGINDPSLGREIRYGGHPSPATSTALMLQESKELLRTTTQQLRLQFSRMGEDMTTLYQQFESRDSGKIERAIGTADGTVLKQWRIPTGPIAGTIEFDVKAMTETLNPETEREKAIFIMQATGSFYTQVLQLVQVAAHPQTPPPGKLAAARAIEALSAGFEKVLESAQVDDVRKYVLAMKESNFAPGPTNEITASLTDNLRQLAANNGQQPLPVIPSYGNGAPQAPPNGGPPGGL